ncbi:MAG: M81 family metallopeptidase [Rhodospirillaceae bacterium]|nr:M81 family metallopeptidase [Rhodospirillaceae bacterium]
MRLAIAGFSLESVTFLPDATTKEDFERNAARGARMTELYDGSNTVVGGFFSACEHAGVEPVPLVLAEAGAAAAASEEAFDIYLAEIAEGIKRIAGTLDGVLLELHGALVTLGGRTDLDFLKGLRAEIGPDLPIGIAFDLHGNLDPEITAYAQVISAYRESPHVDMGETGHRVGTMLIRALRGEIQPVTVIRKVPVTLPSIFTATPVAPLSEVMATARQIEAKTPGLLDLSVPLGFAYADVPMIGASVIATADGDIAIAEDAAEVMSKRLWDAREKLYRTDQVFDVPTGLDRAFGLSRAAGRPVVVLEHADRMNDSTYVLKDLIRRGEGRSAVPHLWDPSAAEAAIAAGLGATVTLTVGGHSSPESGGPVEITGKVIFAGDKSYLCGGEMARGRPIDLGPTAVIDTGAVVVWLVSTSQTAIDLDPFTQFGLDHETFEIVVLRSKSHFRAIWSKAAADIVIVDTPDWGPAVLETLPYERARPGVFPIT